MTPSSESAIQAMVDDLVVRAADDWLMLLEVDNVVKRNAARRGAELDTSSRIATGLSVIRFATEAGLMSLGDVSNGPEGFVAWNLSRPDALERIEREWRAVGDHLEMGDVCWLANTPAGDAHAEDVRLRGESGS